MLDVKIAVAAAIDRVVLVADFDLLRISALGQGEDEILPLLQLVGRLAEVDWPTFSPSTQRLKTGAPL